MAKSKKCCNAVGMLSGILAGVALGILFAPKSGKETREDIRNYSSDLLVKYGPQISDAKRQAAESIDIIKCKLEKQYNRINDSIKARHLAKAKNLEASANKEVQE